MTPDQVSVQDFRRFLGSFPFFSDICHGKYFHQGATFVDRVGISYFPGGFAADDDDTLYAACGEKGDLQPFPFERSYGFLENGARLPVNDRVFFLDDEHPLFFSGGEDPGENCHIFLSEWEAVSNGLDRASSGKLLEVVPEQEKVGHFARHRDARDRAVIHAVSADFGYVIQVRRGSRLKGSFPSVDSVAPVAEAIEEKKDDPHESIIYSYPRSILGK